MPHLINKSKMKYTDCPYVLDIVSEKRAKNDDNILSLID